MAIQTINIGSSPNKGDGDPLRVAFDKINDNFVELYAQNFGDPENQPTNIIPSQDGVYDLGSLNKQWADLYVKDFIYINGIRLEATAAGNIAIAGNLVEIQDRVGSVFGDDSTVLVDGVNSSINLDGTVKGDIIPDTDVAYDLGSASNRFRDLYLSGSTINLGGLEITNDGGVITFGGEKVVVEGGTGDVQGSVFGDDSTLLVDAVNSVIPKAVVEDSTNWDTAFSWGDHSAAGYLVQADILDGTLTIDVNNTGDLQGSVFGDDSTLLVDAINSVIPKANVESSADWDTAFAWGDHSAAGYAPQATTYTKVEVDTAISAPRDIKGSVFADDSTLLVDAVAGKIVGPVETTEVNVTGDITVSGLTYTTQVKSNGQLIINAGPGPINTVQIGTGSNVLIGTTGKNIDFGGPANFGLYEITVGTVQGNLNGNVTGNVTGDLTGSVFADDSTLLVDGVNGNVTANILTSNTASNFNGTLSVVGVTRLYDDLIIDGGDIVSENSAYFFGNLECSNITNLQNNAFASDNLTLSAEGSIVLNGNVSLGTASGSSDFYGEIEFNNGTTAFQSGNSVDFNTDVDLNGEVKFAKTTTTGGSLSSAATALDVTKTLQVLNSADSSDDWWSLADGTEGQIMHFVPGTGAGTDQHKVTIANWRRWDSGAGVAGEWVVETNLDWLPFKLDFDGTRWTGVATAIFTDGAWQTNNPWID